MPQEAANVMTTNVMTPYEIIATVIDLFELLQPFIIIFLFFFFLKIRVYFIRSSIILV